MVYGEGSYSADVFSAGVAMIELWVGSLWRESKGDTEDESAMVEERGLALQKVQACEPKVARLLRTCTSADPGKRPSPKKLLKELRVLAAEAACKAKAAPRQHNGKPKHQRSRKQGRKA